MRLLTSLKTFKTATATKETQLKTIQHLHPHLLEYTLEEVLDYFDIDSLDRLKEHIQKLQLLEEQKKIIEEEKIKICYCSDSKGKLKDLYARETFAEEAIKRISLQQHLIKLKMYRCPYACGWHLSKL